MLKKHFTPEQIVTKLKLIEVLLSQGKQIMLACREAGISDKSYYRWRNHYNTKNKNLCRAGYVHILTVSEFLGWGSCIQVARCFRYQVYKSAC